jgi:hypothetical protein
VVTLFGRVELWPLRAWSEEGELRINQKQTRFLAGFNVWSSIINV